MDNTNLYNSATISPVHESSHPHSYGGGSHLGSAPNSTKSSSLYYCTRVIPGNWEKIVTGSCLHGYKSTLTVFKY